MVKIKSEEYGGERSEKNYRNAYDVCCKNIATLKKF